MYKRYLSIINAIKIKELSLFQVRNSFFLTLKVYNTKNKHHFSCNSKLFFIFI